MPAPIRQRDPIALLSQRNARKAARFAINAAARADIRRGLHRGVVMERHGISVTAYEQLAAQVREGFTA